MVQPLLKILITWLEKCMPKNITNYDGVSCEPIARQYNLDMGSPNFFEIG